MEELVKALQAHGFELSVDEIADALWLAIHMGQSPPDQIRQTDLDSTTSTPENTWSTLHSWSSQNRPKTDHTQQPIGNSASSPNSEPSPRQLPIYPPPLSTEPNAPINFSGFNAVALRVPAVTPLPNKLAIGRALRPFKHQVASRFRYDIDEEATATCIANQQRLPSIILRPARERWLDIALIIDHSASMRIWQQTIQAWCGLLERHGAFRNLRIWHLHYVSEHRPPVLVVGPPNASEKVHQRDHRELIDSTHRRIMLVVSDCISSAWYNGTILKMIESWGKENHVSIVQMLPMRLWARSGLRNGFATKLQFPEPVAPNRQIQDAEGLTQGLCVPVTTLDVLSLAKWADVCTKGDLCTTPGYVFDTGFADVEPPPTLQGYTAQDRVERFWYASSDPVRRLAGLLSYMPLTLPVIRLVQHTMFPPYQRRITDIAEVLLSGLVDEVKTSNPVDNSENLQFEFITGVRDILASTQPMPEQIQVWRAISDYIADQTGKPSVFPALLATTTIDDLSFVIPPESRPFTQLAAPLLRQLGGKYKEIANKLDMSTDSPSNPEPNPILDSTNDKATTMTSNPTIRELETALTLSLPNSVRQVIEQELVRLREQQLPEKDLYLDNKSRDRRRPSKRSERKPDTVTIVNSTISGVVAGVIIDSTINQFFDALPPVNGESLLKSYLEDLIADCNHLRLERMTEKHQTRGEHATGLMLRLQDIYTSLTTDGSGIILDEQTDTFVELEQLYDEEYFKDKTLDNCDPSEVQYLVYEDVDGTLVTPSEMRQTGNYDNQSPPDYILRLERPELAFDAIRRHRLLVLLGEPGSGKSTVLRYLAVLLARKLRGEEVAIPGWEEVDSVPVPIFCPLRQVTQALTATGNADEALWQTLGAVLEGAQPQGAGLREYLEGALNRGGVILLCDGLDELPLVSSSDAHIKPRRAIAQAIQSLARAAPQLRIVLTSRVKPYYANSDWRMSPEEGWDIRTIQPLAFGQVCAFIQSWYHALIDLTSLDAAARSKRLISEIEQHPHIHPLVASPLLLTMLTILHYNTDRIPRDRATLYHECVQLLLERWEPVRSSTNPAEDRKLLARLGAIPGLELDQLRMVLHDLAFEAHNQPPSNDGRGLIDGEKLDGKMHRFFANLRCPDVSAKIQIFREVLEEDAGLLQVHDHDRYAFSHLTFQEYLTACYLVDQIDKEQRSLAYERWCSSDAERWREVLLLMMGRLRQKGIHQLERDGAPWLEYLLTKNVQFATKVSSQRQRDLVLAALSYAEIEGHTTLANWDLGVEERIEEPLRAGLVELLAKPDPQLRFDDRVSAARVLGQISDPRFPVTIDEWCNETFTKNFGKPEGYWCYIPAGTYCVGGWEENKPAANITLLECWIACFPITVAQFQPFVEVGYSDDAERWWTPQGWQWKQQTQSTKPIGWNDPTWTAVNQPVIGITWYEGVAFVNWLMEQFLHVLPEGYRLRLPTEAEWEVAAAFDTLGTRHSYPWGETIPTWEYAVYNESRVGSTVPVGCCPRGAAPSGVLDMAGNVWEWTCSNSKRYPQESGKIVEDFETENFSIPIRGGSWWTGNAEIRCGARYEYRPDGCMPDGPGFRIGVFRVDDK